MDRGYIKLWRKIIKWGWFSDTNTFHFFTYLLMKASYTDSEFLGVPIKTGQAVIGLKQTSIDTGLTCQNIRTAINHLKSTNEITVKSTNKFTIVTILNYSNYQSQEEIDNTRNNKQTNKPLTNDQQTTNNIQEVKKVRSKEVNNKYNPVPDDEFLESIKTNKAYNHMNIDIELSKMDAWLLANPGKKKTRRFIVNWLNRHERPLETIVNPFSGVK